MAAIIGLDDAVVEEVCASIDEIVVAANYNCPGQLVISGSIKGIEIACEKIKSGRCKTCIAIAGRRSFSFAIDGTGAGGIGRCH